MINLEGTTTEKEAYQKKLTKVIQERDMLNEDAKSQKQIRDKLNACIKETLTQALNCRDKRDTINTEVEKYKKLRNETNKKIQTVDQKSEHPINIQKEIEKIDKTLETQVLTLETESKLIKRIQYLSQQLQQTLDDKEAEKETLKLKELSQSYHDKVVKLSIESQNTHKEMLEYFQKTDEIRDNADKVHHKFMEIRSNASKKHDEVKKCLDQIRNINFKLKKKPKKEINTQKRTDAIDKGKEKALMIYKKFKEGKKLNHKEFLFLQEYNLN